MHIQNPTLKTPSIMLIHEYILNVHKKIIMLVGKNVYHRVLNYFFHTILNVP